MIVMYFLIQKLEANDKSLLTISYEQIFDMIKLQIPKIIQAPQMKCIFIGSFFNFISLIYCQLNFPCPTLLFVSLFIQASLSLISIAIPKFTIFVLFMITFMNSYILRFCRSFFSFFLPSSCYYLISSDIFNIRNFSYIMVFFSALLSFSLEKFCI